MDGFGPPMMMNRSATDKLRVPRPTNIKEVPGYLSKVIRGFFSRLFYIFGLVWETRPWILFFMLFMAIFHGVVPVIGAYITANILTSLITAGTTIDFTLPLLEQLKSMYENEACRKIVMWLVIQFCFTFVRAIINEVDTILTRIYGELVVNHIKIKIMKKAKDIDLASFDTTEFYEKLENANREAGMRPIQILNATFNIFSTLITLTSFIVVLWAVSHVAPLLIVIISIPSAIIHFIYRRKNAMYVRHRSKDRRVMNYFSNILTNKDLVKEVRMFGTSDLFIERYNITFWQYFKGLRKLFIAEGLWHTAITLLNAAVNCGLYVYIALQICNGRISEIGYFSLYVSALHNISSSVSSLIRTTATIYEGTLFIDNMIDFMKNEKTIVPLIENPVAIERHIGHTIEFDNVSFHYPNSEVDVIKNVCVTINAGETAVLVGLNGAGKTTLVKLLTRLYDPTEGRILLDGRDIREYKVEELYKIYGIIFQDFGKYAVTVKENIALGQIDKEITQENIERAAVQSNADIFIEQYANKYETPLMRIFEDNGTEPSIGQWQKLAIARAFYSDSDILILDEPTASLDPIAETEIFNQFDQLRKDRTTIFVSHRLSSATIADKILVLEYGQLIEVGSHRELMEMKGKYYELFSTQAKRYIESSEEALNNEQQQSPNEHYGYNENGYSHRQFGENGGRPNHRPFGENGGRPNHRQFGENGGRPNHRPFGENTDSSENKPDKNQNPEPSDQ